MSNHPILDALAQLVDDLDIEEGHAIDFWLTGVEEFEYEHEHDAEELGRRIAYAHGVSLETEAALVELANEIAKMLVGD